MAQVKCFAYNASLLCNLILSLLLSVELLKSSLSFSDHLYHGLFLLADSGSTPTSAPSSRHAPRSSAACSHVTIRCWEPWAESLLAALCPSTPASAISASSTEISELPPQEPPCYAPAPSWTSRSSGCASGESSPTTCVNSLQSGITQFYQNYLYTGHLGPYHIHKGRQLLNSTNLLEYTCTSIS